MSNWFFIAGVVLLGWVLIRRQLIKSKTVSTENHQGHGLDNETPHGVSGLNSELLDAADERDADGGSRQRSGLPLSAAPPQVQRAQAELLEMQRVMHAEMDTKIAIMQSLLLQCEQRLAEKHSPDSDGAAAAVQYLLSQGQTIDAIAERLDMDAATICMLCATGPIPHATSSASTLIH
ncbi:MAG: hypothetical protein AAFN70_02910 [Planctomycetota bacterium]